MPRDGMLYKWLKNVQMTCYPHRCVLCGKAGDRGRDLCTACFAEMPRQVYVCLRCGRTLQAAGDVCAHCIQSPPPILLSVIPFHYRPPLDHLILALKFQRQLAMAPLLAQLMLEASPSWPESPDCLLPVPLHPGRMRERGFNQAQELARELSCHSGIPLAGSLATRQRNTATQSLLSGAARRRNMRDAFVVQTPPPAHVVLVDDVVTTGSTVNELARVLLQAGAERVDVWACARA